MKRKILYISLIIFVSIMLFAAFAIKNIKTENPMALIYKDGKLIKTIDLSSISEPYEFVVTGSEGEENIVHAEKGKVCIISASCPDKICVNRGYISGGSVPIVCLPNEVVIKVEGSDGAANAANAADAAVG